MFKCAFSVVLLYPHSTCCFVILQKKYHLKPEMQHLFWLLIHQVQVVYSKIFQNKATDIALLMYSLRYLPRHQFGSLQGKMFPAYFMLISVCSAISVAAFAYLHPWKTASTIERYQLGFLISALGFDLSNLLVFTPMTTEVNLFYHFSAFFMLRFFLFT